MSTHPAETARLHCSFCGSTLTVHWPLPKDIRLVCACGIGCWEPTPIDGRACPHGDETCPCQDGDLCHYEGPDPWYCRLHQTTHIDGDSDA
jgi:hypothetical protein